MLKEADKFLNDLNNINQNLFELMKINDDEKQLKEIEKEMERIQDLIKSLTKYINYYKVKSKKSSDPQK